MQVDAILHAHRMRTFWTAILFVLDSVFFYTYSADFLPFSLLSPRIAIIVHITVLGVTLFFRWITLRDIKRLLEQTAAAAMRETADELTLQLSNRGGAHH